MSTDGRLEVENCEVAFMTEHSTGNIVGELLHLFPYVAEEGITRLMSYHHDGEGEYSYKVHGHGGSGSDEVGAM